MKKTVQILILSLAVFSVAVFPSACGKGKKTGPVKAKLEIDTVPAGASVTIAGKTLKNVTPVECQLPAGVYILKITKNDCRTEWVKVTAAKGKTAKVSVNLAQKTSSLLVSARANKKFGVRVIYNNKDMGETPLVLKDLPFGKGEIILRKSGYSPMTVPFEITEECPSAAIDYELSSNQGQLHVNSIPGNAEVFIDGNLSGRTELNETLEEGRHSLIIRKAGYMEHRQSFTISRGRKTELKAISLHVRLCSLHITAYPSGAKVFVNEEPVGDAPRTIANLKPGDYEVRAERDGFDSDTRKITLQPGENGKVHLKLDSNMGALEIVTKPAGVSVFLDGKFLGRSKTDADHPQYSEVMRIPGLKQGKHTVRIVHKRARKSSGKPIANIVVKKGQTVRLTQELWIPDTRLYMKNGEVVEGRFISKTSQGVFFEAEPGIKYERKNEIIQKIEKIPMEEE